MAIDIIIPKIGSSMTEGSARASRHGEMMPAAMGQVQFDNAGLRLVGDAVGPDDGAPLLFLHGGGQTRQSWGGALHAAAQRGYRAIAIDLRGHGQSGWSPDGNYAMEQFAGDVRHVALQLGRPPALIGASLGGLAALLVAATPPPLVTALVLVDVAVTLESEGTREIGAFMTGGAGGFATPEEAADAVAAYLPHRSRPKDTSGLMRNLRLREDGRYYWHWDPAFVRLSAASAPPDTSSFEAAARHVSMPTCLVRGGRSRVLSQTGAQELLGLVPQAEFVEVADADHMVAGDANDAFNAAVFGFLARHVPAA